MQIPYICTVKVFGSLFYLRLQIADERTKPALMSILVRLVSTLFSEDGGGTNF
jgi:hypothetical protein